MIRLTWRKNFLFLIQKYKLTRTHLNEIRFGTVRKPESKSKPKNTINDGGSNALFAAYTGYTVDTVGTVDTEEFVSCRDFYHTLLQLRHNLLQPLYTQ